MSQPPQNQTAMDIDTMLDVYIYDYLVKRKLIATAKVFEDEAKVPVNVRAIHAPRGFLFEWWTVFWDIFISRYKFHQGSMEPCDEAMRILQMVQQQQENQHQTQIVNTNDTINVLNPMRQPIPKQWHAGNMGVVLNPSNSVNHLSIERQKQALDISSLTGPLVNQSAQGPECLQSGAYATGVLNNIPLLKGWPLMGLDQIQSRFQQQQGAVHGPQVSYQHQIEGQLQALNQRQKSQMEGQLQALNNKKRSQSEGQFQPPVEKMIKQPSLISPGAANSSETVNAKVIVSSSAGDVSVPSSPHNEKINIDEFLNYGALDGNDSSFPSRAGKEPEVETSKDFTFLEVGSVRTTSVNCCDISLDGKLVAIGGQDKKARLLCTSSEESKSTLDGHSQAISDIRFSPTMRLLATSSHDKTVRIWDLENPGSSIRTFMGHSASVKSVDFHPKTEDIVCSCDENEIRFWTIKNSGCVKVDKASGGANKVRFQCGVGKYLAIVNGKFVSLLDLEHPEARKNTLKGHESNVQCVCWNSSGDNLISISEDSVNVWRLDSGGKVNCIRDLSVSGKRFCCGTFHPCYPSLLIIGCHQSLELWNMVENKMITINEEPVSAVAVSYTSGLIASAAGHNDDVVKFWK
ncbi:transcriptional corepressor LEUNIG_HOMOLOG-like [Rutidosis leptorrhynchoides]|uniref:transcriptional corepressor LEUNIG_HOMOLOG-like n=1 Tax=Rutidosis leptorrhynchoides TaxID=125765 RepID=UPI003A9A16F4